MRTKNLEKILYNSFWIFIYLFPLIYYGIFLVRINFGDFTLSNLSFPYFYQNIMGFGNHVNTFAYNLINGFLGLFTTVTTVNGSIICFLTYFVSVNIVRLFIDFLLFFPRKIHDLMESFDKSNIL